MPLIPKYEAAGWKSGGQRVKGVTMDMHEAFRQAVQICLPQTKRELRGLLTGKRRG